MPHRDNKHWQAQGRSHGWLDDVQAILTGTLLASLGVFIITNGELMTGGTVGLAALLHYATGTSLGVLLFLINLPFYLVAVHRKGWAFSLKSLGSVLLLSTFVELMPHALVFGHVHPLFGAIIGGLLAGVGILVLFRHNASLGGFNILALYLQERLGWRAGVTLLTTDAAIYLASFALVPPKLVLISMAGAVVLNLVLVFNHNAGRLPILSSNGLPSGR
jgi:uncharacterized membrane-anchored protein YitT (DUF2179 family)